MVNRVVYLPSDMEYMLLEGDVLVEMLSAVVPLGRRALVETPGLLGILLAYLIHSSLDRDRSNRGCVLEEVAETLTWEETGMPSTEHCRTPRWPNSNLERSAPDLIFLAVRRARYTRYRLEILRSAWK